MSKDLPENIAYSSSADNTTATQQPGDILYSFMNAPVSKLDADQYMVSDLDGITEGLFGSGNMNFLMMQSAQTNESIHNANPMDIAINGDMWESPLIGTTGAPGLFNSSGQAGDIDAVRPFGSMGELNGSSGGSDNGVSGAGALSGINAAAARALSPSSSAFSDITTGINGSNGNNGTSGTSGTSGVNGNSGTSGNNGTNGLNGNDGTGTVNNINNFYESTTNIFDTINNITENTFITINNILGGEIPPIGLDLSLDLSDITNLTLDIFNGDNILNVINETIDLGFVLDPVEELVGNIASGLDLGLLIHPFTPDNSSNDKDLVLTSALDLLGIPLPPIGFELPLDPVEFLLGDIDLNLGLTNDLLGLPILGGGSEDTDLDLDLVGNLLGTDILDAPLDLLLDPVEDLVGDIDLGGTLNLGLLNGPDTNPNDTDITIPLNLGLIDSGLATDTLDISLDPPENIIGDIDLDLGVAANLLGNVAAPLFDNLAGGTPHDGPLTPVGDLLSNIGDGLLMPSDSADHDLNIDVAGQILDIDLIDNVGGILLNPVEDLAGDLDIGLGGGIDLLGTSQTSNTAGDTDIVIPLDLNLAGHDLLDDALNIPLDPIEALTGDIDLDLTVAGDVLGNTADSLIDGFSGGTGNDTLLSQTGNLAHDLVNGLLPSSGNTDITSDLGAGLLGTLPLTDHLDVSLDTVENLLGSNIDLISNGGLDLLGTSNGGTDTDDVSIAPDVSLLNNTPLNEVYVLNLDPVESLVGDIDLTEDLDIDLVDAMPDAAVIGDILGTLDNAIQDAVGILGNAPATLGGIGLTDALEGLGTDGNSGGLTSWTESLLPDAGDILGGGLTEDISSILPDPVAAITSLAPVPVLPIIGGGLGALGGHGGGNHFGGLFG